MFVHVKGGWCHQESLFEDIKGIKATKEVSWGEDTGADLESKDGADFPVIQGKKQKKEITKGKYR